MIVHRKKVFLKVMMFIFTIVIINILTLYLKINIGNSKTLSKVFQKLHIGSKDSK
jgi:hypothetical protein